MNAPSSTRTYQDPEDLFLIQLPADWLVDTSGESGTGRFTGAAFISPQVEGNFQANVNVVVNYVPPLSRDEYLTLNRLQLKMASGLAQLPVDQLPIDQWVKHRNRADESVGDRTGIVITSNAQVLPLCLVALS